MTDWKTEPIPWRTLTHDEDQHRRRRRMALAGIVAALAVLLVWAAAVDADRWEPRNGCGYRIAAGDTLTLVGRRHGMTVEQMLASNPHVTNPDVIYAGGMLDVCPTATSKALPGPGWDGTDGPGNVHAWAQAVQRTAPPNASNLDVWTMVALAGPESTWCTDPVNPADADPPKWGPSVGCVQVRTLLRAADLRLEPFRDRAALESSLDAQAEAAWIIWGPLRQGFPAWSPAKHVPGVGGTKLPPGGPSECGRAVKPAQCRGWWQVAADALGMAR